MFTLTSSMRRIYAMQARIRAIQGGTSAGKTIAILSILIDKAQRDTKPTITSVVAESVPHLKRGAIRDFLNILKEQNYFRDTNWNATDFRYTFETGSQIEFFSSDNGDKLRGARRDRLFINEANNVHKEAFEQLEVRTKETVWIDWNPTSPDFWFYTDLLGKRDDIEHIIVTYKDNEALDANIVKAIEARRHDLRWWRVYGEGMPGEVEEQIYKNWEVIEAIPVEARLITRGLDFGYTNDPTAIVDVYKWNGDFIVDEKLYKRGQSNQELAEFLKSLDRIQTVADSAEPKSIDELKKYNIDIKPAQKGQGSILQGISFLQSKKLFITPTSHNLKHELQNYLFVRDDNGKLTNEVKGPDHALDALRYAVQSYILEDIAKPKFFRQAFPHYSRSRFKR